jgi:hypothetical protein
MSGGSFDYLCFADLVAREGDVTAMRDALAAYPRTLGMEAALRDTDAVLAAMAAVQRLQTALSPVWRAVEWHRSGDIDENSARETIDAYKGASEG